MILQVDTKLFIDSDTSVVSRFPRIAHICFTTCHAHLEISSENILQNSPLMYIKGKLKVTKILKDSLKIRNAMANNHTPVAAYETSWETAGPAVAFHPPRGSLNSGAEWAPSRRFLKSEETICILAKLTVRWRWIKLLECSLAQVSYERNICLLYINNSDLALTDTITLLPYFNSFLTIQQIKTKLL